MQHSTLRVVTFAALIAQACSHKPRESMDRPQPTSVGSASLAAAPSRLATPTPSSVEALSLAIPAVAPRCREENHRLWASGVNKLAGLTQATLPDGRVAIGFAVGNQPQILLVGANANGHLVKVPVAKNSRLASVPKGATRLLLRVTPVKVEGENVQAFVDVEDHYPNEKRAIVCGPADANENWVEFEGIPFAALRDTNPAKLPALFHQQGAQKRYDEVHSCRTFTDLDRGETWVLRTDLRGDLQPDNSVAWRSEFAVATGSKAKPRIIESTPFMNKTVDGQYYEVPVARAFKNGSVLVAARHRNHLIAGILGADKSLVGRLVRYPGYPKQPEIAEDGVDALVLSTTFAKGMGNSGQRAIRVRQDQLELPRSLNIMVTDRSSGEAPSESDPEFIRDAHGQRWLGQIDIERGSGRLSLAPIDRNFIAMSHSYAVTQETDQAAGARLAPLKDQGILVVFLRAGEGTFELVSAEIHCNLER